MTEIDSEDDQQLDSEDDAISVAAALEEPPGRLGHLIVGIGASAGGLAAFKSFFAAMPADSGIAFVLVQHLDPKYDSALAEIVGEFTAMPVLKAMDGTVAEPNTVAVIPQNALLRIAGGILRVASPESPLARRSTVDTFLMSLAEDQGDNAVAIILSGFGSDGTIGVAAVKERGGLTMSEAEFDHQAKVGMPRSAAAGGFVDRVLPVADMPAALLEYAARRAKSFGENGGDDSPATIAKQLTTICAVLSSRLGRDFMEYKSNTLVRRVRRRMQALGARNMTDYVELLRTRPDEPELLFQEFLIGVTRFFRDPSMFDTLTTTVLRPLIADRSVDPLPIRIWVCGCATGEEAYSLAIVLTEELRRAECRNAVTIFATDLDERSITFARAGIYPNLIETDVSPERLEHYFEKKGSHYRIAKCIREICVFSVHDLTKDPPFSRLDLVACRNLLIYFSSRLQRRVIGTFHYSLRSHGALWLGPSEAILASHRIFKVIDKRARLFRRADAENELQIPISHKRIVPSAAARTEIESLDQEVARLMSPHTPAHIIVDTRLDILKFSAGIAKFLEPASGSARLNVMRLLHAGLRSPTATLVRKAIEDQRSVEDTVTIPLAGQTARLRLIAEPVALTLATGPCVLLIFHELAGGGSAFNDASSTPVAQDEDAQRDLNAAREKLETVTEELATANEELQSSNEEFQSVNEELHSTVEELETSKEELQSINEELQTVNAELSSRAESLARANSDLTNLFESTSIPTLFLDVDGRIRRFTPTVSEIFNVREGDEGRPLSNLTSRLEGSSIVDDARAVLNTLQSVEREVETADRRTTFLMRIKPYRSPNNVIDGTVITLVDISERKRLERARAHLAAIVQSSEDAIIGHDLAGIITSWNRGAETIFGYSEAEIMGRPMSLLLEERQVDEWPQNLARLRAGESIANLDVRRVTKENRRIDVSVTISPIRDDAGLIVGGSAVARDVSERKSAEERAALLMAELDHRVRNILAVAGTVVTQTLRSGAPIETLHREIGGRIAAIARAQSILTGNGGVESSLRDLVEAEVAPYRARSNVVITEDTQQSVLLSSDATLTIGLALHELATNAAKYGALSNAGRVDVSWCVTESADTATLLLNWMESGGPPVETPTRRGFGTKLIELSLERGLRAKVTRDFHPSGLRCSIELPFNNGVARLRTRKR